MLTRQKLIDAVAERLSTLGLSRVGKGADDLVDAFLDVVVAESGSVRTVEELSQFQTPKPTGELPDLSRSSVDLGDAAESAPE